MFTHNYPGRAVWFYTTLAAHQSPDNFVGPYAAIITTVPPKAHPNKVDLIIIKPNGDTFVKSNVPFGDAEAPCRWEEPHDIDLG